MGFISGHHKRPPGALYWGGGFLFGRVSFFGVYFSSFYIFHKYRAIIIPASAPGDRAADPGLRLLGQCAWPSATVRGAVPGRGGGLRDPRQHPGGRPGACKIYINIPGGGISSRKNFGGQISSLVISTKFFRRKICPA